MDNEEVLQFNISLLDYYNLHEIETLFIFSFFDNWNMNAFKITGV